VAPPNFDVPIGRDLLIVLDFDEPRTPLELGLPDVVSLDFKANKSELATEVPRGENSEVRRA
jgi:hypothetical protein